MHTHMLFSRFYTLLCALETAAHTPYTIYFALIHHCTNSLSSLHIFVHHCTFCASLHTKTSPGLHHFVLFVSADAKQQCFVRLELSYRRRRLFRDLGVVGSTDCLWLAYL